MALRVTHVRMSGGTTHEHIVAVAWTQDADHSTGSSTTAEMVSWIEGGGHAYTRVDGKRADVGVRKNDDTGRKFLQTHADGYYNNNLLALPRF